MSEPEAATPTRKQRRTKPTHSLKDEQLAQLCTRVYDDGKVVRREGEPDAAYFRRIREKALQILRFERAKKRKTVRAARRRNRR